MKHIGLKIAVTAAVFMAGLIVGAKTGSEKATRLNITHKVDGEAMTGTWVEGISKDTLYSNAWWSLKTTGKYLFVGPAWGDGDTRVHPKGFRAESCEVIIK